MTAKYFANQDLRGRSFKGQDLSGADFSYADIRGANFKNAILKAADFTGAKAGLQKHWLIGQILIALLVSTVLNFVAVLVINVFTLQLFSPEATKEDGFLPGISLLLVLVFNFIALARQGFTAKAVGSFGIAVAVLGAIAVSAGGSSAAAVAVAVVLAIVFSVVVATVAVSVGVAVSGAGDVAGTGAVAGIGAGAILVAGAVAGDGAVAVGVAVGVGVGVLRLSIYVTRRVTKEDERFAVARTAGLWLGTIGGTSFRNADLTEANFSGATLNNTNFTDAIVIRSDWLNTQKLDRAERAGTILNDIAVRKLLVSGEGSQQNYQAKNLKGANLIKADLVEADLTEADISNATLERADLCRANLTKTQALGTNFENAVLTGACLESLNIDSTTRLDGIICDYVYLLLGERRPSSGYFGPGEFSKLFQEVLDTIDLIFTKGIDWRAFMLSLDNLKVASGDADISVQSIENKGDGVFVVRLATPPGMDKEAVHSGFMQDYEHELKLIETTYRARLEAKQEIIDNYKLKNTEMTEIIKVLAQRPIHIKNIAQIGDRTIEIHGEVHNSILNQAELGADVNISPTDENPEIPDR